MIYLDHNASTPIAPEVREAIDHWGGVPAAVARARSRLAALLGCSLERLAEVVPSRVGS